MNDFGRLLRLALAYRWTVAGTVASSLMVALLWGGNITAVYPLVETVLQNKTAGQWVDERIAASQQAADRSAAAAAELEGQLRAAAPSDRPALEAQLATVQARQTAEEQSLAGYRRAKPLVDRYTPGTPFRTLVLILLLLVAGTLVKSVFVTAGAVLAERLGNLVALDVRRDFFNRTLQLDLPAFGDKQTSELLSRFTNDLEAVAGGITIVFGRAIREPFKALACLAGAAWVSWRLLLLSLIVAPLAALLVSRLSQSLRRSNRRALERMTSLYNLLLETFTLIKAVKAFTLERQQRQAFYKISKEYYQKSMRIAVYDALVNPLTEMMGILTICLAILAGAWLVLNQQTHLFGIRICDQPLDYGRAILFYGLLAGVSDPARKISEVFNRLQKAAAASQRVIEMLDREPKVCDPPEPRELPRHCRDLVFEQVSFAYSPDRPVLEKIDLTVRFGETLAIVGPNGCGKSTLANLALRLFDPDAGTVRLDGVDVRQVRLRDLRGQIGLVAQETLLFNDTVFNNILHGDAEATREQVLEAARRAHAHKFIEQKLESGYDTLVGPQGSRLSGGQRQRIALARAILRNPAILILDEATSQIDVESEQLIQRALTEFARDRTTIVITHRLATLELADRIAVMHAGQIVDVGTHAELSSRCELFRRLYEVQFQASA